MTIQDQTVKTAIPLLDKTIRPLDDWAQWLDRWVATNSSDELLGLLHCGFDVSIRGSSEDRFSCILFYFKIAEYWNDYPSFPSSNQSYILGENKEGYIIKKSLGSIYKLVAQKAFDMLCQNFFKKINTEIEKAHDDNARMRIYESIIAADAYYDAIMHFFRPEREATENRWKIVIPNLSRYISDHPLQNHAIDFLTNLATYFLNWKEETIESYYNSDKKDVIRASNSVMRKKMHDGMQLILEIFNWLNMLSFFDSNEYGSKLNKAHISKLKEIALRSELDEFDGMVNKARKVRTIEEACFAGSHAAWIVKRYELLQAEKNRLKKIMDAENNVEQARKALSKEARK